MPFFGTRIFNMPHQAHLHEHREEHARQQRGSREQRNRPGRHEFDGFAHQSHGDSHYNCYKTSEIATRSGFTKLGCTNAPTFFARGVMLDVAALKVLRCSATPTRSRWPTAAGAGAPEAEDSAR